MAEVSSQTSNSNGVMLNIYYGSQIPVNTEEFELGTSYIPYNCLAQYAIWPSNGYVSSLNVRGLQTKPSQFHWNL